MAATDWQVWLHILLLWSILCPGEPHPLLFWLRLEADTYQFMEFLSSCPRSSEGLDTRSLSQISSPFRRTRSQVRSPNSEPLVHLPGGNSFPAVTLLVFGHFSDKLKLRWPFVLACLLTSAVGFGINISDAPAGVKYFGTFLCVAGSYSAVPGIVAW